MHHLLHHANCADGFAAACIARHALLTLHNVPADDITLTPVNYGWEKQRPDSIDLYAGDSIYYLDYTPPADVLRQIHTEWGDSVPITVIDHHSTAAKSHGGEPNKASTDSPDLDAGRAFETASPPSLFFTSVFNLAYSGAALTWQHFFRDEPLPRAINLIQHRDLGRAWQEPTHLWSTSSLDLHAYLMRALPRTVEAWIPILTNLGGVDRQKMAGAALRSIDRLILKSAAAFPHWLDFTAHGIHAGIHAGIPAVNGLGPELVSEACQTLLESYPAAPFAASWWIDPKTGLATYSLRSRKGGFNVAELAARIDPPRPGHNGGGGHPQAAGFSTDHPIPFTRFIT